MIRNRQSLLCKRNRWLPLLLILFLLYLTFGHRILFEHRTLAPVKGNPWLDIGASYWVNASMGKLVNLLLKNGEWPLWNDYSGIGTPLFSDPHNAFFSPFSYILYLLPNTHGWDLMTIIRLFTLITASYFLFLKILASPKHRDSIAVLIALTTAALLGYSGHVFYFLNLFHLNSLAFFPLLLLGIIQTLEKEYSRGMFSICLAFPLMVFGGGLLDTLLAAIFSFCLIFAWSMQHLRKPDDGLPLLWLAMFGFLGLCFASIYLLPYLDVRTLSIPPSPERSKPVFNSYWYALGLLMHELAVTPRDAAHYYMNFRQYLHIICLPGLLFSITMINRDSYRFSYVVAGGWIFLLFYFLKLYGFPPLNIVNNIPLLQDIRFEKYQGGMNIAYYLLAATGTYHALTSSDRKEKISFFLLCLITACIPILYIRHYRITPNMLTLQYTLLPLMLLGLAGGSWILSTCPPAGRQKKILATTLGVMGIILGYGQILVDFHHSLAHYQELFPSAPLKTQIRQLAADSRVMPLVEPGPRVWSAYGIHDVRNISVIFTKRYRDFFKQYIEKNHCWHPYILCSSDPTTIDLGLLAYIGTNYVVINHTMESSLMKNREHNYKKINLSPAARVLKLNHPTPVLTLTNQVIQADAATIRNIIADPDQRNPAVVYLETTENLHISHAVSTPNQIKVIKKENGYLHAQVSTNANSILIYSNQYYPGWKAYIDGKRTTILRANYLFQAIQLPAGSHSVRFVFLPTSLIYGSGFFLLALTLTGYLCRHVFPKISD